MATVTNRARAARVLALASGSQATLAPGQTDDLDIATGHPIHEAWVKAGDIEIATVEPPEPTPEDKPNERKRRNTALVG